MIEKPEMLTFIKQLLGGNSDSKNLETVLDAMKKCKDNKK